MVPIMVPRGIFTSGFSTFSAGIVPHSRPKNAYKVNAATTGNVAKLLCPVKLNSGKFSILKKKRPTTITKNKGTNFKTVVTTWNFPDFFTPLVFNQVNIQMSPKTNTDLI